MRFCVILKCTLQLLHCAYICEWWNIDKFCVARNANCCNLNWECFCGKLLCYPGFALSCPCGGLWHAWLVVVQGTTWCISEAVQNALIWLWHKIIIWVQCLHSLLAWTGAWSLRLGSWCCADAVRRRLTCLLVESAWQKTTSDSSFPEEGIAAVILTSSPLTDAVTNTRERFIISSSS